MVNCLAMHGLLVGDVGNHRLQPLHKAVGIACLQVMQEIAEVKSSVPPLAVNYETHTLHAMSHFLVGHADSVKAECRVV